MLYDARCSMLRVCDESIESSFDIKSDLVVYGDVWELRSVLL